MYCTTLLHTQCHHHTLTKHKIQHHENIFPVLKCEPQVDNKIMLNRLQYLYFPKHIFNGMFVDDLNLVHVFHGIHLLSVPLFYDAYLGVAKEYMYATYNYV